MNQKVMEEAFRKISSFGRIFGRLSEMMCQASEQHRVYMSFVRHANGQRYVPLSDRMRTALRLREPGDNPWIFPSNRSRCGHRTTIAKQWTATVAAVNLAAVEKKLAPISDALVLYCARHTFGTDMLEEGMNIVAVAKILGHEDIATTMKYLHPDTTKAAGTVNRRNSKKKLHLLEAAS
jgi:integrase